MGSILQPRKGLNIEAVNMLLFGNNHSHSNEEDRPEGQKASARVHPGDTKRTEETQRGNNKEKNNVAGREKAAPGQNQVWGLGNGWGLYADGEWRRSGR